MSDEPKVMMILVAVMLFGFVGKAQSYQNGRKLHTPDGAVWVMWEGKKRHIPNPDVYNRLFRDALGSNLWNIGWDEANRIPTGDPIGTNAWIGSDDSGRVWFFEYDKRKHIGSPAIMDKYNLKWPGKENLVKSLELDKWRVIDPLVD